MSEALAKKLGETYAIGWPGSEPVLLINLLEDVGIEMESLCGGAGTCGKCRVQVLDGDCLPAEPEELGLLSREDLDRGWRLACYCRVRSGISLRLERSSGIKILENSRCPAFKLEPVVRKQFVSLAGDSGSSSLFEQLLGPPGDIRNTPPIAENPPVYWRSSQERRPYPQF